MADTGIRLAIGVNGSYSSSGGQISLNEQSGNSDSHVTSRVRIDDGKWHHVAFCRDNLTRRCFVDGELEYRDTTVSRNMHNTGINYIGRRSNGQVNLKYLSNFRMIKDKPCMQKHLLLLLHYLQLTK